jgi:hypothetical protein
VGRAEVAARAAAGTKTAEVAWRAEAVGGAGGTVVVTATVAIVTIVAVAAVAAMTAVAIMKRAVAIMTRVSGHAWSGVVVTMRTRTRVSVRIECTRRGRKGTGRTVRRKRGKLGREQKWWK